MEQEEVDKSLDYDSVTGRWVKKMAEIVAEAGRAADYEKYFMTNMDKTGFTSITDMPKDKRKKFFSAVNKSWKSKEEKRKAIGKRVSPKQEDAGVYTHVGVPDVVGEVAPPGREKQVKALKKKFGANSAIPFKIAWAQSKGGGHREDAEVEETMRNLEITPPGFPEKIKEAIKNHFANDPKKANKIMWSIHDKMKDKPGSESEPDDAEVLDKAPGQDAKGWYDESLGSSQPFKSKFAEVEKDGDHYIVFNNVTGIPEKENDQAIKQFKTVQDANGAALMIHQHYDGVSKQAGWKDENKELDETSSSGAAPGYATPFAFSGGKSGNEKRRKMTATSGTGYKIVGDN